MPLLVRVLAGNPVTSAHILACLNTADATRLRRVQPAVSAEVARVPWGYTDTPVVDAARWRTCFPAAVGARLTDRAVRGLLASDPVWVALGSVTNLNLQNCAHVTDAVLLRLPASLHALIVRGCESLTASANVAHLPALQLLDVSHTAVGDALLASLPATMVELRLARCRSVTASARLDHLHALRVLHCIGTKLSPAALAGCRERGCVVTAVSVLRGHTGWVFSLALLSDGRLASGDRHGDVRLWDVERGGEATAVLDGHDGEVFALAVLPDGRRLAAGVDSRDGVVVWDTGVVPPTRCATFQCGSGVYSLAVLRDGRLAAGCKDGGVRLVEVGARAGAGAVTATLRGHTGTVIALAALPDGTLASGSRDNMVRLWDVGAQACVATLAGHTDWVRALTVLADGRLASGSNDWSVRLWDVATRACVGVLEGHPACVCTLAVLPDGRLVSGSDDHNIRVWGTRPAVADAGAAGVAAAIGGVAGRRATPAEVLDGHTNWVIALQPLPGGHLASGSGDKTVCLWRLPPL